MVRPSSSSAPGTSPIKLRFKRFSSFVDEYASFLSLGGMFIKTATPARVGSSVDFEVELTDGYCLLRGRGQVAWRRSTALAPELPAGMAVRFKALDDAGRELVLKILEEQVKSGGSPFDVDEIPADAETARSVSVSAEPVQPFAPAASPPATAPPLPRVRDSGFDAPWGNQLPEVPADVLDDSGSLDERAEPELPDADSDEASFYAAAEEAAQELDEFPDLEQLDGGFELIDEEDDVDQTPDFAFEVDGSALNELSLGDEAGEIDDDEPTVVTLRHDAAEDDDEPTVVSSSRDPGEDDDDEPTLIASRGESADDAFTPLPTSPSRTTARSPAPQGVLAASPPPAATSQARLVTDVRQSQAAEVLLPAERSFAAALPVPSPDLPGRPTAGAMPSGAVIPRPPAAAQLESAAPPRQEAPAQVSFLAPGPRERSDVDAQADQSAVGEGAVLDYEDELHQEKVRRRSVSPKAAAALTLVLVLAGGAYYFKDRFFGPGGGEAPPVPSVSSAAEPDRSAAATDRSAGVVAEEELAGDSLSRETLARQEETLGVPQAEPQRDTGTVQSEPPAGVDAAPPPAAQSMPQVGGPASEVTNISYQQTSAGTVVIVQLDGELVSSRVVHDPLSWAEAREQVAIVGIHFPYRPNTLVVGSPELKQIRTGLHSAGAGSELRLVFDLAQPDVYLADISADGPQLRVLVQRR